MRINFQPPLFEHQGNILIPRKHQLPWLIVNLRSQKCFIDFPVDPKQARPVASRECSGITQQWVRTHRRTHDVAVIGIHGRHRLHKGAHRAPCEVLPDQISHPWHVSKETGSGIFKSPLPVRVEPTDTLTGRTRPEYHQAALREPGTSLDHHFLGNVLHCRDHNCPRKVRLHHTPRSWIFFNGYMTDDRHA